MKKYTFTKTITFSDSDLIDIISSAVYDIGYWSCIDNDTDAWHEAGKEVAGVDYTFEDIFFHILKSGKTVELFDIEDNKEVWELTLAKLLRGIQMAMDNDYWDGDVDELDGSIGDIIFQYALFDDIVFG